MRLSGELSGAMSRAGPGTGPSCSIHGPRSASLIPHFGLPLLLQSRGSGGCLKNFSPFWKDVLGCTQYALEAVEGFCLHFTTPPRLSPCRVRTSASPLRARTIVSSTKMWMPSFPRRPSKRCLSHHLLHATSVPSFSSQKRVGVRARCST
jgi:hypothetical protein